jgi:signal transduction histidine kinase
MSLTDGAPLLAALEGLAPHDHLCSIYESPEERLAVAIPFIRIGLDRGERCVYIADDGTEAAAREAMHAEGIDVERAIATDRLVLAPKEHAYLKDGSFDPDWMFTFWAQATVDAMNRGFSALRLTGETEWVFRGAPGLERWVEYESRMTHMLARHNCSALCQYDRRLFPPELVLDVIRTHPTVIYRGLVCRNLYYVPPDELLGADQAAREVERLLTNIREREEIEYQRRRLESITDAALAYLSLDDLLRELLTRLRSVLRAEYASVRLVDEAAQELILRAVDGAPFERVAGVHIPLEFSTPIKLNSPYVVGLVPPDPGQDDWYARLWAAIGLPMRTGMGAPLLVEGKPIGVVNVASSRASFTEEDQRLLQVVADRVAPAIERGRLVETVSESRRRLSAVSRRLVEVQETERREIARELHDEVGQLLTGLLFRIEGHGAGPGDPKDEMKGIVNAVIDRVRDLSMDLRPPMLDELGLLPALTWQVDRFEARTGIRVRFHHAGLGQRFGARVEITAFRIVQEALTNVARHASVGRVSVDVWANPVSLGARIEDRGRGFDVEAVLAAGSSGLEGMRERSRLAGGHLAIESAPGDGTRLLLELPLDPASLPREDAE